MARTALTHFGLGSLLVVGLLAGVGVSPIAHEIAPSPIHPSQVADAEAGSGTAWSGGCPEDLHERVCAIAGPSTIFGPQMIRFAPRIRR